MREKVGVMFGLEHDIVSKSGSFFSYGKDRLGQGRGNAKAHLNENPAVTRRWV